jgi:hypothetical protein
MQRFAELALDIAIFRRTVRAPMRNRNEQFVAIHRLWRSDAPVRPGYPCALDNQQDRYR